MSCFFVVVTYCMRAYVAISIVLSVWTRCDILSRVLSRVVTVVSLGNGRGREKMILHFVFVFSPVLSFVFVDFWISGDNNERKVMPP